MAEVELKGITKTFDKKIKALNNIDFKVCDKEFVTLLGPSGCGKSTLLRILAGLEAPDSGEVIIGGVPVNSLSPGERDIAMVFQSYALYPHMNVSDNIAVNMRIRRLPKDEIRQTVRQTSQLLGIADLLDRKPRTLSGGQRQRVALARAIVRNPKVFLLDEPLSNLDASLRETTRGELKLLLSRIGATVIYVTHDQVEAMTLSHRIVVLKDGIIQQIGTPEEIYVRPENVFVAAFVGSPRINLLDGAIEGNKIKCNSLTLPLPCLTEKPLVTSRKIAVGIRPEDIFVETSDGVEADVVLIEPIGSQAIVTLQLTDMLLKAIIPASQTISSGRIKIGFDTNKFHVFDKTTSLRLN
jgi:multiple sugar transport system ATP-binding protein